MIRNLRGVIKLKRAGIGVFLTLSQPSKPRVTEAAGAGLYERLDFAAVLRIQLVMIEKAMALRDRAVMTASRKPRKTLTARHRVVDVLTWLRRI